MLILGVATWYFGNERSSVPIAVAGESPTILQVLWRDFLTAIFVLVPCFYAGMGACVELERRGYEYQNQYLLTFRAVSGIVFLAIFGIWAYFNLIPFNEISIENGIDAFRLVLIFYIFDGNVADGLWDDIFSKRKKTAV